MFTVRDLAYASGGVIVRVGDNRSVAGVSIDSRTVKKGELFIAIKGNRFDGHRFIRAAVRRGASIVVFSGRVPRVPSSVALVKVRDTTRALGDIARFHRNRFSVPVIAITGSAGKTTTKDMVAAVLSARYRVLRNEATQNNHIGVPMTLLRLRPRHEIVVAELGTNHCGEIAYLTRIAEPTVALFTNIGESHLASFRTPAGVFREKSALVRFMRRGGCVIFNNDDTYLRAISAFKGKRVSVSFGIDKECDCRAQQMRYAANRGISFYAGARLPYTLKTPAYHNIYNALSAIVCGRLFDVPERAIRSRLLSFRFPAGRQRLLRIGRYAVIDDTYNASPVSFKSALETLKNITVRGRKAVLCADMLELGTQSRNLHRALGRNIAAGAVDCVVAYGREAREIIKGAREGSGTIVAYHEKNMRSAVKRLRLWAKPGDVILVKGSRGMHMEKAIALLNTPEKKR